MMDIWSFMGVTVMKGIFGVFLLIFAYKIFDLLTPDSCFEKTFEKPNITNAGIVLAAFLLGLSFVISGAAF